MAKKVRGSRPHEDKYRPQAEQAQADLALFLEKARRRDEVTKRSSLFKDDAQLEEEAS